MTRTSQRILKVCPQAVSCHYMSKEGRGLFQDFDFAGSFKGARGVLPQVMADCFQKVAQTLNTLVS